jgi:hypothetical protein
MERQIRIQPRVNHVLKKRPLNAAVIEQKVHRTEKRRILHGDKTQGIGTDN